MPWWLVYKESNINKVMGTRTISIWRELYESRDTACYVCTLRGYGSLQVRSNAIDAHRSIYLRENSMRGATHASTAAGIFMISYTTICYFYNTWHDLHTGIIESQEYATHGHTYIILHPTVHEQPRELQERTSMALGHIYIKRDSLPFGCNILMQGEMHTCSI